MKCTTIRVKKEWTNRLNVLKAVVKWLTETPEREITYEYLFYDSSLGRESHI